MSAPMTEELTPYRQGFRARRAGDCLTTNPFPADTDDAKRWAAGWEDQDDHMHHAADAISWLFAANNHGGENGTR